MDCIILRLRRRIVAKKKVVDEKKLLKVIDSGVSQAEVMEKFGFNTSI